MIEKKQGLTEKSVLEMLDEQYIAADNKDRIDYWEPLSKIILESVESRDLKGLSQTDLARLMKTKQSVISRFENMGRLPNYDFMARLSLALGHSPGMTLYGDFMAVVPLDKQNVIKELAEKENISTRKFVQSMLDSGITLKTNTCEESKRRDANTTLETILDFNTQEDDIVTFQSKTSYEGVTTSSSLTLATPYQNQEFSLAS